MSESYEVQSIPSAKDILDSPLSLFSKQVLACEPIVVDITQENYKSYVAAIVKYVLVHSSSKNNGLSWNEEDMKDIRCASTFLKKMIELQNILLDPLSNDILNFCRSIRRRARDINEFLALYNDFYSAITNED